MTNAFKVRVGLHNNPTAQEIETTFQLIPHDDTVRLTDITRVDTKEVQLFVMFNENENAIGYLILGYDECEFGFQIGFPILTFTIEFIYIVEKNFRGKKLSRHFLPKVSQFIRKKTSDTIYAHNLNKDSKTRVVCVAERVESEKFRQKIRDLLADIVFKEAPLDYSQQESSEDLLTSDEFPAQ